MQRLVVQALAMRQLGRLNPRHLLAAGYGLGQTEWSPRTIHTRQLWGCSGFPVLGCHRPAPRGRDPLRGWSVHHLRFKSRKNKPNSKGLQRAQEEEEEESEDEYEKDPEDSDSEDEADQDPNLPKGHKDLMRYVQSLRYDLVMKAGMDTARGKVEDAFYEHRLRLNGQKLLKKSKTVFEGDTLDLILVENKEANTVTLTRIILKKILGQSENEKYKISLRRWTRLELSNEDLKL